MAPGPRPRPATPADLAGILGLIHDLADYERARDQVQTTFADLTDLLFGVNTPSGSPAAFCLVLDDPDHTTPDGSRSIAVVPRLAGMALWFLTASTWTGQYGIHLEDLYVRPEHRGRGFGLALMAELASVCQDRGYQRLEWAVLDWNAPALGFYRTLGAAGLAQWTTHRLSGGELAALALRRLG